MSIIDTKTMTKELIVDALRQEIEHKDRVISSLTEKNKKLEHKVDQVVDDALFLAKSMVQNWPK